MVQNQVELDLDAELVQCVEVFMADEFLVDVVVDDRKPAIEIAVEERRQDVEQRECVLQLRTPQERDRVRQIAADAVGIGVEHDPSGQSVLHRCGFVVHELRSTTGWNSSAWPARLLSGVANLGRPYAPQVGTF